MGREYQIECDEQAIMSFDGFLRSRPYFESYDAGRYNLRVPGVARDGDWPDGYACIDAHGIYFCDNLTAIDSASRILRSLIDYALSHSEHIVVREP